MNIKHIQYVLTVLREGSITGASKKLYVSQPALSQTIKQIEQDLGASIFDRTTDPISLTFAGQKYVEAAQQMLDIDRNLRAQIAEMKDEIHGRIRVGISVQRGLQLLPHVIPEFARLYPFVKVELIEHGSDTLERMTAEGQCDIALVATSEKPNKLNYVLIENEQVVLMVARSTDLAHRFDAGTPIEITEAQHEKFVSVGCQFFGKRLNVCERLFFIDVNAVGIVAVPAAWRHGSRFYQHDRISIIRSFCCEKIFLDKILYHRKENMQIEFAKK